MSNGKRRVALSTRLKGFNYLTSWSFPITVHKPIEFKPEIARSAALNPETNAFPTDNPSL